MKQLFLLLVTAGSIACSNTSSNSSMGADSTVITPDNTITDPGVMDTLSVQDSTLVRDTVTAN